MGVEDDCGYCVGVDFDDCVDGGALMVIVLLSWILLLADQVRMRVRFGLVDMFITGFLLFFVFSLYVVGVEETLYAGLVAAGATAVLDEGSWVKRGVHGLSFGLSVLAGCGVASVLPGVGGVLSAGVMFEFVNMLVLAVAFKFILNMSFVESLSEWFNTGWLMVLGSFVGVGLGVVFLQAPYVWPLVGGVSLLLIKPVYFVFSGGSLLHGSWHTGLGISLSRSRLSVLHSRF